MKTAPGNIESTLEKKDHYFGPAFRGHTHDMHETYIVLFQCLHKKLLFRFKNSLIKL